MCSGRSQSIADARIGVQRGLPHHSATAKEYCPSSSAVARHFGVSARVRKAENLLDVRAPALSYQHLDKADWLEVKTVSRVFLRKYGLHDASGHHDLTGFQPHGP